MIRRPRFRPQYRVGDEVVVKSLGEILDTLDDNGELESMPFMPEMIPYCGRRMRVVASAHKTCDGKGNVRRMRNAVHLVQARCDGSSHGRCQQRCRLFFKYAWITPADQVRPVRHKLDPSDPRLRRLHERTKRDDEHETRYRCQFTSVVRASEPLPPAEPTQYLLDVTSGNRRLRDVTATAARSAVNLYQAASRRFPRWLQYRDGQQLPVVTGNLRQTPQGTSEIGPGDRVRIRSLAEIRSTLNADGRNRGLGFGAEDSSWCGTTTTVLYDVDRIIDETSGRMIDLTSDCLILDGVMCRGRHFRGCPRGGLHFWREVWLDKLPK